MTVMTSKSGFTLVELLVTISIIGLLFLIVTGNIGSSKSSARDKKRITDIQEIQLALEFYFQKHRTYPASNQIATVLVQEGFLVEYPAPPLGTAQTNYAYISLATRAYSPRCTDYHLGAVMEQDESKNSFLKSDLDAEVRSKCATEPASADFDGNSANCSGSTAVVPDRCFDASNSINPTAPPIDPDP